MPRRMTTADPIERQILTPIQPIIQVVRTACHGMIHTIEAWQAWDTERPGTASPSASPRPRGWASRRFGSRGEAGDRRIAGRHRSATP